MEAVATKAKSKKERSQNKAVLDVADLFAGWALLLFFGFNSCHFYRLESLNHSPFSNPPHTPFSAGPADAARTPRAENRPTRGGSEGSSACFINRCMFA